MTTRSESPPAEVPLGAPQAGEAQADRQRWAWVERCVWTDRMLTALEEGVKGDKWFRLIDKVYALRTLTAAFSKVKANRGAAGVDHQPIGAFEADLDGNLARVSGAIQGRTYRPQAIRRVYIPKPGRPGEQRPLGIPTVRDRVVQTALRAVIEPIFECGFAEHSYGFRPERGCKDALRRVDQLLKQGYTWVVDADLKSYFDMIPRDRLMERIRTKIADGRVLTLIEAFLNQGVLDSVKGWAPQDDEGRGTPQGAVISPLLSNIYLDPLDHLMASRGIQMVRYADDFVILCPDEHSALEALKLVQAWAEENGLRLHPEKTRVVDSLQVDFDFLGYRFWKGLHWPSPKSQRRLKDAIRAKTKRTRGDSMQVIAADVSRTLRGWFEYFKHCRAWRSKRLDGWVRMRLRSILRRRNHRRGRSRGRDHQRWTNEHFTKLGLYSMEAAHALAREPARR